MADSRNIAELQKQLLPWKKAWSRTDFVDPAPIPPSGVLERLIELATTNPSNETILRELCHMQCLTGAKFAAAATLKKIISLPGKRKPKQVWEDKTRLENLLTSGERDPFLAAVQLTREEYGRLGAHIDTMAELQPDASLKTYKFTRAWVVDKLSYSSEQWDELEQRLWAAGAYNDFYVMDRHFDMQ